MTSEPAGGLPGLPLEQRTDKRQGELIQIQKWCLARAAQLRQLNDSAGACCLTGEHREMLVKVDSYRTLWMRIEMNDG